MEYLSLTMLVPIYKLAVSDFRNREISVMWLVILALGTLCIPIIQEPWREVVKRSGQNLLLMAYMSAGVTLWSWIRARKIINPINTYIGLGDALFFLILIPLFPFRQYIWLLTGCAAFSLAWWLTAAKFGKGQKNIPFVGTSGIVVGAVLILKVLLA